MEMLLSPASKTQKTCLSVSSDRIYSPKKRITIETMMTILLVDCTDRRTNKVICRGRFSRHIFIYLVFKITFILIFHFFHYKKNRDNNIVISIIKKTNKKLAHFVQITKTRISCLLNKYM